MDHSEDAAPSRRPRQQLSCVQCRRRKVKCDHERPCKRCRIRGWDAQCSYPLDIPPGPRDRPSPQPSPRSASIGRDWRTASPSAATRPPVSNTLGSASAYATPSEPPPELATPESGNLETIYGFLPRASQSGLAQRTTSEPTPLATPVSASPHSFPRPPSIAPTNASERPKNSHRSENVASSVDCPEPGPDYALYLNNGESVYFGRSSSPWLISKFGNVMSYIHERPGWKKGERISFIRIKRMTSQQLMISQDQEELPSSGLSSEVPAREVADVLVSKYFQSTERIFTLFDAPKFWMEYESFWQAPNQARLVFVVMLLLIVCMGNSTMPHDQRPIPRSKIVRWWRLGLTWQSAAAETNERMISTLQACCLIVQLRQAYSLSETAEWVSSGSLVKSALAMGLHRDPSKLQNIPAEDYELRRRVFYTVLELDLQYCLNAGMLPTIRLGDWDTLPPEVLGEARTCCLDETAQSGPKATISIQAHMLSSFYVRMKIACIANAIIPEDNYDRILDLSNQLTKSFNGLENGPASCQTEILKSLYNRYLLTLHVPFALTGDPKFAFSQNVCLTSALSILEQIAPSPPTTPSPSDNPPSPPADHVCITSMHASGLLFKNAGFYATLYLSHELIRDNAPGPSPRRSPGHADLTYHETASIPSPAHHPPSLLRQLPSVRDRVVALIERFVKLAEERLRTTQFAGKAFLIPRMVLAHHRISEDRDVKTAAERESRLLEAGECIAEICFEIFCSNPDVAKLL
ncbi:hypothetical protein SLS56_005877 [Neofusicoccum ribis]|uniref:Zn(2)-C6 fungal-type domain-containing protein n=1 Tax=Neofusicoccum ribis TaxID=45134 RepID=A0ABR3SSG6_9PEZI